MSQFLRSTDKQQYETHRDLLRSAYSALTTLQKQLDELQSFYDTFNAEDAKEYRLAVKYLRKQLVKTASNMRVALITNL